MWICGKTCDKILNFSFQHRYGGKMNIMLFLFTKHQTPTTNNQQTTNNKQQTTI